MARVAARQGVASKRHAARPRATRGLMKRAIAEDLCDRELAWGVLSILDFSSRGWPSCERCVCAQSIRVLGPTGKRYNTKTHTHGDFLSRSRVCLCDCVRAARWSSGAPTTQHLRCVLCAWPWAMAVCMTAHLRYQAGRGALLPL